jgi:chaperonin cofactor prefoldin
MVDSISLEQLQEQRAQFNQTVSNLVAQKATLEDQLENCKATLASNQGALQYAVALITSLEEDAPGVGDTLNAESISIPEPETDEAVVL